MKKIFSDTPACDCDNRGGFYFNKKIFRKKSY